MYVHTYGQVPAYSISIVNNNNNNTITIIMMVMIHPRRKTPPVFSAMYHNYRTPTLQPRRKVGGQLPVPTCAGIIIAHVKK